MSDTHKAPKQTGRLLVVDDDLALRHLCRHTLTAAGHQVTVAESGPAALEIFRPGSFDLVLTDLVMPGLSGLDLLARLLEIEPDLTCVMMTAQATIETAVEAIKRGAYDYVAKPFSRDDLVALVARALEVRWLRIESARLRDEAERSLLLLATEQSRTRAIVQSMADGVLVINRDGQLVLYNPSLLRLLGIKRDLPQIGLPPSPSLFPQPLLERMQEAFDDPDAARLALELPGGPPHLSAAIALIRDERGDTLGAVAVVRDITETKNLQERMSDFVSMVAHELRSPLGAIGQYLEVILSGTTSDQPEKEHHILGRCRSRASALSQLVNDLLEFSRLQGRRRAQRLKLLPLDVVEIVRETVEFASQQAAARRVSLTADLPSDLPPVEADRDSLLRLFTNFVDNAIKYNREGGSVTVAARATDGYALVEIADTGLGIPQDHLARLGEAFFRVKTPQTAHITGTGLGLSICRQIIEAHNGHLEIESAEGEGSTFRVLLPRTSLGDTPQADRA